MSILLKIKVTKEILEKSKLCKEEVNKNCAIALAVRDIFPGALVCHDIIYPFRSELSCLVIKLPKIAQNFIREFDVSSAEYRANMPEIEFEIDIPDAVIEQINIDELKPLLINHSTLELIYS